MNGRYIYGPKMNVIVREVQRRLLLRHISSERVTGSLRFLSDTSHLCHANRTSPAALSTTRLQHYRLTTSNRISVNQNSPSYFSSAAILPESDEPPKKKNTNRNRDPITVTASAANRIYNLISNHNQTRNQDMAIGIRLGTKKRGCNGLSYTLDYAYENHTQKHKRDEAMEIRFDDINAPGHGLKVFIEPMALMNVIGTIMDFVDDEMSSEFTFTNPNSKGECGCGESFNV